MKFPTTMRTACAAATTVFATGFVGVCSPPSASADQAADAGANELGSQKTLANGDVLQGWTVSDLKPSSDSIAYPVQGTLWEATATDEAIKGYVIPIVPNLGAHTPSGQTYKALYQVATPQGVNPATLAEGQKTTGKVYFDVTGDKPDSVIYNAGGKVLASWVKSQPTSSRSGIAVPTHPGSGPVTAPAPAAAPVPAGNQQTPTGSPATAAATRSQGTPTSGSQGTPLPANSPAPLAPQPSPAPPPPAVGGQEVPAASPAPPAPAGGQEASAGGPAIPAPAGSQGTPLPANSPAPLAPQPSPAPPAPAAAGQEAAAASPAPPAPETSPPPPAPAGGQAASAGSPATPAPTGNPVAPAGSPAAPTSIPPAAPTLAGNQGIPGSVATPAP